MHSITKKNVMAIISYGVMVSVENYINLKSLTNVIVQQNN